MEAYALHGGEHEARGRGPAKPSLAAQAAQQSEQGLMEVMFLVSRRPMLPRWALLALLACEALQMLSFAFSPLFHFQWRPAHTSWLIGFLGVFNPGMMPHVYEGLFTLLFWLGATACWLVFLSVLAVARSLLVHSHPPSAPARLVQWWAVLSSRVLLVPLTLVLLSAVGCGDDGMLDADPSLSCDTGAYKYRVMLGLFTAFPLLALDLVLTVAATNRDPLSEDLDAMAHPRVAVAISLCKFALCAIHLTVKAATGGNDPWLPALVLAAATVLPLLLHTYFQPLYSRWTQRVVQLEWAVTAWAGVCTLVALGGSESDTNSGALLYFVTLPVALVASLDALTRRFEWIKNAPFDDVAHSPLLIEVKIRHFLPRYYKPSPTVHALPDHVRARLLRRKGSANRIWGTDPAECDLEADSAPRRRGYGPLPSAAADVSALSADAWHEYRASTYERWVHRRRQPRLGAAEAQSLRSNVHHAIDTDLFDWMCMERAYKRAAAARARAPSTNENGGVILSVFVSLLYEHIARNHNLASLEVHRIDSAQKGPRLDDRFHAFAFKKRRQEEVEAEQRRHREEVLDHDTAFGAADNASAAGHAGGSPLAALGVRHRSSGAAAPPLDPLSYAALEHHLARAKFFARRARRNQIRFWQELMSDVPDLNRLFEVGNAIHSAVGEARSHFATMVQVHDSSPDALRIYAAFLLDVLNDEASAQDLVGRADELEDERATAAKNGGPGVVTGFITFEVPRGAGASDSTAMRGARPAAVAPTAGDSGATDGLLDMYDEANAVVVATGHPRALGAIVRVNTAAERLIGCDSTRMLGAPLDALLAPPYAGLHRQWLRAYLRERRGLFINRTRTTFVLHADGYIIPVRLSVHESVATELQRKEWATGAGVRHALAASGGGGDEDAPHHGIDGGAGLSPTASRQALQFVGVMQPVVTDLKFAIVGRTGVVLACSKECLPLFRCTLQDVEAGHIHINDWLPEFFTPRQAPQEDPKGGSEGSREGASTPSDANDGTGAGARSKPGRPVSRFMERVARNAKSMGSESSESSNETKSHMFPVPPSGPRIVRRRIANGVVKARALARAIPRPEFRAWIVQMRIDVSEESALPPAGTHTGPNGSRWRHDLPWRATARMSAHTASEGVDPVASPQGAISVETGSLTAASGSAYRGRGERQDSDVLGDVFGPEDEEEAADARNRASKDTRGGSATRAARPGIGAGVGQVLSGVTGEVDAGAGAGVGSSHSPSVQGTESTSKEMMVMDESDGIVRRGGREAGAAADGGGGGDRVRSGYLPAVGGGESPAKAVSDASSSHGSSSAVNSSRARALRRAVASKNSRMDPSLLRLQQFLTVMVGLFTALAFASATGSEVLASLFGQSLSLANAAHARTSAVAAELYWMQELELVAADKLDSTYRARAVEKLEELTAQVTALHRDLYFEGRVVDPMVAVKGRVVELRGSGVGTRRLNMWMAAFETNAKIKVVLRAQGKADALEALQSELYFVRRNGLATVLPATSDANSVYRDHVISMVNSLETLQLTVLLLIVVPFFASLFVGYGPTVRRVEASKLRILRLFLDIPSSSVGEIVREREQNGMNAFFAPSEHEPPDVDSEAEGDEAEAQMGLNEEEQQWLFAETEEGATPTGSGSGAQESKSPTKTGASVLQARLRGSFMAAGPAAGMELPGMGPAPRSGRAARGRGERGGRGGRGGSRWRAGPGGSRLRGWEGRSYTLSQRSYHLTLVKFSLLYVLTAALFLGGFLWSGQVTGKARGLVNNLHASEKRQVALFQSSMRARAFAVGHNLGDMDTAWRGSSAPAVLTDNATALAALQRGALAASESLQRTQEGLMYGDASRDTVALGDDGSRGEHLRMMFEDGCAYEAPPNCSLAQGGVMEQGVDAALSRYAELVLRVTRAGGASAEAAAVAAETTTLDWTLLRPLLASSHDLYREDGAQVFARFTGTMWLLVSLYAAANGLVFLLVYRVMLDRLDRELRNTRSMLLMVPSGVAKAVPRLAAFMRNTEEL